MPTLLYMTQLTTLFFSPYDAMSFLVIISSGDTKKAASKEGNPEKYNTHSANEAREGTYERQYKQHWKDYWQRKGLAGDYD